MKPLRIVLVMIEPPLPFGNAAARWYYVLLKGLVERGHRVTAFAACSKPAEMEQAKQLFPSPRYDLRLYPFPHRRGIWSKLESLRRPYSYMFSLELRQDLERELAAGYDILHLEQLWSAWLALKHTERTLVNVHHLQWIDLEQIQGSDLKFRFRIWQIRNTEERLIRYMTHFRSCSPRLVPEMLRVNPQAQITTVPVGIDAANYPYIPNDSRSIEPIISVIGSMGWHPSRSAAERLLTKLWPSIKAQVPEAKVQVIGWDAKSALSRFMGLSDITIEENVPDTRPYFERTSVMLYAPARGSGMKIKILEAMGYGVPVVTTSEGVEGLPALDDVHAGLADDDAGLIQRAVRLLTSTDHQNRLRFAARQLIERYCSPDATITAIESIYNKMN